jgi:deazaflavin-dependent oxidoreductase (nitroreductase family)
MRSGTTTVRVPPPGTRGFRMPAAKLLSRLARPFMEGQLARYQNVPGPEPGRFMGFPVLLLTTIGARSGHEHTHVLGGFPDGDDAWLVIASNGGARNHPHWFFNLAKNPDQVWMQVGDRKMKANVECLQGTERIEAFERVAAVARNYRGYQKNTDREIPVIRLTPAD